MALVQGMLYREEKMILYNGNLDRSKESEKRDYTGDDEFFSKNYDNRFNSKFSENKV